MKNIILAAMILMSAQIYAGVADIEPSADSQFSRVEKVLTVQRDRGQLAAIRLVQVDNGGSSDISSLIEPSSLYLTFHRDGEEFDTDGTYLISQGMSKLKLESVDLAANVIRVSYLIKTETNTTGIRYYSTLYVSDALQEIASGKAQNLTATIGMQTYVP